MWVLAIAAGFVAAIPAIYALIAAPPGGTYLGYEFNTDDHMVYSAWMRQAMDGRFFFDNRFTTDAQPGLTVHLYFFVLGLLAKGVGLAFAAGLARVALSVAFVPLAYRLIRRMDHDIYKTKLALTMAVIGGGLGFLPGIWHDFGQEIVKPAPEFLKLQLLSRLPTDVWQPEGFVFPSMLTNGLFMVSLCLILIVLDSILRARDSWKPVAGGAVALGVLMNIHSYDVLIVALTVITFALAMTYRRKATAVWAARAACIGLGVIPAALWFVHVLHEDPVFRERAATETFSPNFRQLLAGYLPLVVVALAGLANLARHKEGAERVRKVCAILMVTVLYAVLWIAAANHGSGYFLDLTAWACVAAVSLVAAVLLAEDNPTVTLLIAWALIGFVAPYFPALFQRKLAMGLSIPWAVLSAYGLAEMLKRQDRSSRNLATVLALLIVGASSIRWLVREGRVYISENVSSTTRHPVYISNDVRRIVAYLNGLSGRIVVLAVPGSKNPVTDPQTGAALPDQFLSPMLPDLAPIITGLTGAYSYAGHWSETPNYEERCAQVYRFFFARPVGRIEPMTDEERRQFIERTGANYAIVADHDTFVTLPILASDQLGDVVVDGTQFDLVKLRR